MLVLGQVLSNGRIRHPAFHPPGADCDAVGVIPKPRDTVAVVRVWRTRGVPNKAGNGLRIKPLIGQFQATV